MARDEGRRGPAGRGRPPREGGERGAARPAGRGPGKRSEGGRSEGPRSEGGRAEGARGGAGAGKRPAGAAKRSGAPKRGGTAGARAGGSKGGSGGRPERRPKPATEPMRIHRLLARAGVASRRAAEELVGAGRVTVNGEVATVGQVVEPGRDRVLVDGQPITLPTAPESATWLLLHKPQGYVTTRRDEHDRPTVFSLVPDVPGLVYVGRLDFLTEGVLLLTTDGEAANRLAHPRAAVERTYEVDVLGDGRIAADVMREGVELEDGWVYPKMIEVENLGRRRWRLLITITEGRTREIRRLCEVVGLEVQHLVRTRFGPITLGNLPLGESRPLRGGEVAALREVTRPKAKSRRR